VGYKADIMGPFREGGLFLPNFVAFLRSTSKATN